MHSWILGILVPALQPIWPHGRNPRWTRCVPGPALTASDWTADAVSALPAVHMTGRQRFGFDERTIAVIWNGGPHRRRDESGQREQQPTMYVLTELVVTSSGPSWTSPPSTGRWLRSLTSVSAEKVPRSMANTAPSGGTPLSFLNWYARVFMGRE